MSVHGIVEQYPGGPYPSQPRHNAESNAEDTEFRALYTKGYFKSMLTANTNISTKPVRVTSPKNNIRKKKKIAVLQIGYREAKQLAFALFISLHIHFL